MSATNCTEQCPNRTRDIRIPAALGVAGRGDAQGTDFVRAPCSVMPWVGAAIVTSVRFGLALRHLARCWVWPLRSSVPNGRVALTDQQEVRTELVGFVWPWKHRLQAGLGIDQKDRARMVDQVAIGVSLHFDLAMRYAQRTREGRQFGQRGGGTRGVGMKMRDELPQDLWRIPFGIDRYKDDPGDGTPGIRAPDLLGGLRQQQRGDGADIGAMGVAEKHEGPLPFERNAGEVLAPHVREPEVGQGHWPGQPLPSFQG